MSVRAHAQVYVCVRVRVCEGPCVRRMFGASPLLPPPPPGRAVPAPTLFAEGKQRPGQSCWAGLERSPSPSLGLASLSICVVLGAPGPDKDGVRARLSWERALCKAPDPFLSQILGPREGGGKARGNEG